MLCEKWAFPCHMIILYIVKMSYGKAAASDKEKVEIMIKLRGRIQ